VSKKEGFSTGFFQFWEFHAAIRLVSPSGAKLFEGSITTDDWVFERYKEDLFLLKEAFWTTHEPLNLENKEEK